jgi:hypothetical protein
MGTLRCMTRCVVVSVVMGGAVSGAMAEQVKYIDEAGNIRFVDRVSEVPKQYREQVVPPTPTVHLDKKAQMELQRRQREAAREKERKELEKKRELQKRQREFEKRQQREAMKLRRQDDSRNVSRLGTLEQ